MTEVIVWKTDNRWRLHCTAPSSATAIQLQQSDETINFGLDYILSSVPVPGPADVLLLLQPLNAKAKAQMAKLWQK